MGQMVVLSAEEVSKVLTIEDAIAARGGGISPEGNGQGCSVADGI